MTRKNYDELEMKDDFMVDKVMSNRELCRRTLETLLEIPIDSIEYPEQQKTIRITSGGKSVRLDVYVEDDHDAVYDAEMQQLSCGITNLEFKELALEDKTEKVFFNTKGTQNDVS